MSYATTNDKKFLNQGGASYLWTKIRERYDAKLDEIQAYDDSVIISDGDTVQVHISAESDNQIQLKTSGNKGLYVAPPAAADTYAITKDATSSDYSAVYRLKKYAGGAGDGVDAGVTINIPKDMVVQSGQIVTKEAPGPNDPWPSAGTFIELTLANATNDKLYISVDNLIEYVTSGSQAGDMVFITVDNNHQVTAAITDGTITKAKLVTGVQTSLDYADTSVQDIAEGSTNGTIKFKGAGANAQYSEVSVHGLGSAAYTDSTAYDAAGDAAAALGTSSDLASDATVYGVKKYASDVYEAIVALTDQEIDEAIDEANEELDGE